MIDKLERVYECVRVCKVSVHFVGFAELLRTLGETSPKNICISFFHIRTMHLDIIKAFSYSPTDAQLSYLKRHRSAVVYSRTVQHTYTIKDLLNLYKNMVVIYVFYWKRLCILIVVYVFYRCLCVVYVFLKAANLTEVFSCFFLSCKANARV